jgi:hypothetical protein
MSVKVCSPFITPTSPKLGLKSNNKKRPFSATANLNLLRKSAEFGATAENMIGTASAGNISAVSRVSAAVESNNSNNQLTAQQR